MPLLRENMRISGDVPVENAEWLINYQHTYRDMFEDRLDLSHMKLRDNGPQSIPWYFDSLFPIT